MNELYWWCLDRPFPCDSDFDEDLKSDIADVLQVRWENAKSIFIVSILMAIFVSGPDVCVVSAAHRGGSYLCHGISEKVCESILSLDSSWPGIRISPWRIRLGQKKFISIKISCWNIITAVKGHVGSDYTGSGVRLAVEIVQKILQAQ